MSDPVDIYGYIERARISALWEQIDVPDGAVKRAFYHFDNSDYTQIAPHFSGLFDKETAATASAAINALCTDSDGAQADDGFKAMSVYMAAALRVRELYDEVGIDPDIYADTMRFLRTVINHNMRIYGRLCFDREYWFYRQISMVLFRLGALEYEMRSVEKHRLCASFTEHGPKTDNGVCDTADEHVPVLSVHIPGDAVMTRENLNRSYNAAAEFFSRFYPEYAYRHIFCSTWLLSPELKAFLPESSRILEFQSDYEIVQTFDDSNFIYWVYDTQEKEPDLNTLPEDTSLRRAIKRHLISGGRIGSASGVYRGR